jgi:hypothetical protein
MSRKRRSSKGTGAPVLHSLNPNAAGVDVGQRRYTSPYLRIAIRNRFAISRHSRKTYTPLPTG